MYYKVECKLECNIKIFKMINVCISVAAGNVSVSLVRLVGGVDPSYGRLEIMDAFGVYKSVCEYGWRHQQESQVVCRELGYRLGFSLL